MQKCALFFLILCFFGISASGQDFKTDTVYVKQKKNEKLVPVSAKRADFMVVQSYKNDLLIEKKLYRSQTGKLAVSKQYKGDRPSGKWMYYNDAGNITRERNFDKLVYGPCENRDSIVESDLILPYFDGGDAGLKSYLSQKIKYPKESKNNFTSGIVYIGFIVHIDGSVVPLRICGNGVDGYCDLVVWEIVENMPDWAPGMFEGENVEVLYYLPVSFVLR